MRAFLVAAAFVALVSCAGAVSVNKLTDRHGAVINDSCGEPPCPKPNPRGPAPPAYDCSCNRPNVHPECGCNNEQGQQQVTEKPLPSSSKTCVKDECDQDSAASKEVRSFRPRRSPPNPLPPMHGSQCRPNIARVGPGNCRAAGGLQQDHCGPSNPTCEQACAPKDRSPRCQRKPARTANCKCPKAPAPCPCHEEQYSKAASLSANCHAKDACRKHKHCAQHKACQPKAQPKHDCRNSCHKPKCKNSAPCQGQGSSSSVVKGSGGDTKIDLRPNVVINQEESEESSKNAEKALEAAKNADVAAAKSNSATEAVNAVAQKAQSAVQASAHAVQREESMLKREESKLRKKEGKLKQEKQKVSNEKLRAETAEAKEQEQKKDAERREDQLNKLKKEVQRIAHHAQKLLNQAKRALSKNAAKRAKCRALKEQKKLTNLAKMIAAAAGGDADTMKVANAAGTKTSLIEVGAEAAAEHERLHC